MVEAKCPFCSKIQKQKPTKKWNYGKMIKKRSEKGTIFGPSVTCSRYYCSCKKYFNYYLSSKNKSWTIPKKKVSK